MHRRRDRCHHGGSACFIGFRRKPSQVTRSGTTATTTRAPNPGFCNRSFGQPRHQAFRTRDASLGHSVKILHLATVASSHRYLLMPQFRALLEDGHDLLAVSAHGPEVAELQAAGIRHRSLEGSTRGFDLVADARAARSFARIVREERPDLVHTHNPKPGLYGRILSRALRVPRVVNTVHGLYATPEDSVTRRSVVYSLEAIAARCSDLELVQNIEDVELMERTPLAPSGHVRFLGNGVDVRRFGRDLDRQRVKRSVRTELGIPVDAVLVITVGRLVAEKGIHELLEASERCGASHELVVVGPEDPEKSDALEPSVLRRAERNGVRLLGHRVDVERLLAAADIFVLASHREGVPRAAMEAAASGLPVIATDIRGCRQVVDHKRTGLLVAVRSAEALAAAMAELINDSVMRDRYGRSGRAKAMEEFDEHLVIRRLRSAYAELGVRPTRVSSP